MEGGKVDAVLRFALATLFMRQEQPLAGRSEVSDGSVAAEGAGLALGADGASDWGFEPGQSDVDMDVGVDTDLDGQQAEDGTREAVLDVVVECMGRLRGVCEDSGRDEDRGERVDEGFRDVARELRGHSERHSSFGELLRLLIDLLRAADAEGETLDAASLSHVLMHLCFEGPGAPSSRFDEVVEFLVGVLNDAHGGGLSEWVAQSLDAIEAAVHHAG